VPQEGMLYYPIQGQGNGDLKCAKTTDFKVSPTPICM